MAGQAYWPANYLHVTVLFIPMCLFFHSDSSPRSLPFPALGFSPEKGSPVQLQKGFLLYLVSSVPPGNSPPSVQSFAWCWPVLLAFTPGNWCWGCPGTGCPFLWVLNLSSNLLVCHCASLDLLRWVFDGLMAPVMSLGVARVRCYLGLPHLLLSFLFECASELLLDNLAESHLISCHLVILQLVSSDVRHPLVNACGFFLITSLMPLELSSKRTCSSFLRDQSKNDQFAVSWIIFLACLAIFRYLQMLCSSLNVMIISYRVLHS